MGGLLIGIGFMTALDEIVFHQMLAWRTMSFATGVVLLVLYLTPLYAMTLTNPYVHDLVHVHFFISGYLFTWAIAGVDPAPHRPGLGTRLAVLFVATATHATLGKLMYAYGWPRGTDHGLAEIQAAAQWMYYGGDLAELLLAIAFFALWFRRSGRDNTRAPKNMASACNP